ncbi:Protein of unknown function [Cotesia congregata]|uniref:Uncharacterized protein n=1 Tax=Cotesia congregata TaxID=51543 RepID=A0A8J2MR53_COTCN|nr:Protein of unknown function [Cotesia congregata]
MLLNICFDPTIFTNETPESAHSDSSVAARLARSRHSDGSCNQTCLDGTHGQQRNYLSNSSAKTSGGQKRTIKTAYIAKNDESHPVTDEASTPAPTQSQSQSQSQSQPQSQSQSHHWGSTMGRPQKTYQRRVTFKLPAETHSGGVVVAARLARSRHSDGSCNQTCLDGTHGQQRNYLSNSSAKTSGGQKRSYKLALQR